MFVAIAGVCLPDAWVHIKGYTFYRFECGLRSSAVLGFVGLPTLGYYLETDFSEGNYSEAAALLIVFYVTIATLGFFIDSAIADIRLDRVMLLILVTALLNLAIDSLSRQIRARLRLSSRVESCQG